MVFFTSPALAKAGYIHGFSTRLGGVSPAPFETLNLGNPAIGVQDAADHITENKRRFQCALGADDYQLFTVSQVHGADVAVLDSDVEPRLKMQRDQPQVAEPTCADAIIVKTPKFLAGMRTADCVPILIANEQGNLAAVVHAGWRGLVAGVIGHCVAELNALGRDRNFLGAIGPCIGVGHYEVGPEVAAAFEAAGLRAAVTDGPKPHVNLQLAAHIELVHSGLTNIDSAHLCTFDQTEWFYSHRRDHGVTGRMLSVIGLPA